MSTLGSLYELLGRNPVQPYAEGLKTVLGNERQQTANQTDLLHLAELERAQQTAAAVRQWQMNNPAAALYGQQGQPQGPPSLLGGGTPPAPAPMTQQSLMPGQPPGAPQMVPGGQDLSRFATPGGSPMQSTLGAPGPQQGQAPQNPLLDLMRSNPDAALAVQGRIQKIQEGRLTKTLAEAEYAGRWLQSVKTPEDYARAREDLARVLPEYAATLPPTYSKESLQPYIDRAVDVKSKATLGIQTTTAQAELQKARMSGRVATTDQYLKALGVAPGQETAEDMQKAIAWQQRDEVARQAAHGSGQVFDTPDGKRILRPGTNVAEPLYTESGQPLRDKPTAAAEGAASYGDRAQRAHANAVALEDKGITPTVWSKVGDALPFGLGNYLVGEDQQGYRQAVNQFAGALLRKESGAAISQTEYNMTERTFFPQPGDSKKQIDTKRQEREAVIKNLQEEGKGAGRTGTQGQPPSQAPAGGQGSAGPGKPVAQMNAAETRAEIAAIKARGGR